MNGLGKRRIAWLDSPPIIRMNGFGERVAGSVPLRAERRDPFLRGARRCIPPLRHTSSLGGRGAGARSDDGGSGLPTSARRMGNEADPPSGFVLRLPGARYMGAELAAILKHRVPVKCGQRPLGFGRFVPPFSVKKGAGP